MLPLSPGPPLTLKLADADAEKTAVPPIPMLAPRPKPMLGLLLEPAGLTNMEAYTSCISSIAICPFCALRDGPRIFTGRQFSSTYVMRGVPSASHSVTSPCAVETLPVWVVARNQFHNSR